jgi:hypothetical protein
VRTPQVCARVDEPVIRIGVVAVLLAGSTLVGWWWSRRPSSRRVSLPGLGPGVVVFTSETCSACEMVAGSLDDRLGRSGYRRVRWEDDPATFDHHGIGRVPVVVVLEADGRGRLWEGVPPARVLARSSGA